MRHTALVEKRPADASEVAPDCTQTQEHVGVRTYLTCSMCGRCNIYIAAQMGIMGQKTMNAHTQTLTKKQTLHTYIYLN